MERFESKREHARSLVTSAWADACKAYHRTEASLCCFWTAWGCRALALTSHKGPSLGVVASAPTQPVLFSETSFSPCPFLVCFLKKPNPKPFSSHPGLILVFPMLYDVWLFFFLCQKHFGFTFSGSCPVCIFNIYQMNFLTFFSVNRCKIAHLLNVTDCTVPTIHF